MTLTLVRIATVLLLIADGDRETDAKPQQIRPGCRYEGRRYQEGTIVGTSEPCLQCRCTEGALRCRLRVCPRLPNSPPPGCHIRPPGENVCCPELICGESRDVENMLRRTNTAAEEKSGNEADIRHSRTQGCLHEGVRYAPGSAMMGSRRCEYCYCISGARRCIRPKCLLPLPGCTPLYAPHSCCPVAYNCTHIHVSTAAPISGNGCRVGDRAYEEGEMVRDISWKAACDNCFCAMAAIRCVPLACAPPLQGCSPIVRQGQCCPSTYNCSGSIEVKAAQNYASYAFISKDYAKFRKETNFFPAIEQTTSPSVEGRGHRVVDERIDTSTIDLESESSVPTDSTSWASTLETEIMDNEILETMDYTKSTLDITSTTTLPSTEESTTNTESATPDSTTTMKDANTITETVSDSSSTLQYSTNLVSEALPAVTDKTLTSEDITTSIIDSTASNVELTTAKWTDETVDINLSAERVNFNTTKKNASSLTNSNNATIQMLSKEEDSKDSILENTAVTEAIAKVPVTSPSSTILMPDDILVMNVTVKTNVSVGNIQGVTINPIRSIPPDVEAILNITHREKGEDYEYDYSEPTLPPSLPNVRIIPFVAADALVKDKDAPPTVTGYPAGSVVVSPELRPTDNSGFYDIATQENRFSPPIETEGGFVPREPPYFDTPYHSTDLNLEIGTGVTVVPAEITNPHIKNDDLVSNCLFENREHRHGEILPSTGICIICMCYYGEVVCSSEKCPPLKIGCQRINTDEGCCGKVVCVDADESPTVVLDRADATAPSQRQPIVSPDPFRDVIKTEPAPDLPSLIEDMIPYLVEHRITTPRATTPMTTPSLIPSSLNQISSHLKPPLNFDFVDQIPLIHAPFDYRDDTVDGLMTISKNKHRISSIPNDPLPLSYQAKEPEQLRPLDRLETFAYNPMTVTRTDYTTSSPPINASNPTDSTFIRVNTTNVAQPEDSEIRSTESPVDRTSTTDPQDPSDSQDEDSIFSLDSALDLFFSSDVGTSSRPKVTPGNALELPSTTSPRPRSTAGAPLSDTKRPDKSSIEPTVAAADATVETPSKILDNEIPVSVAGLLKLAGCNIYGRMYRVGRIITELSGPCLECRCTEIGVQCKQLEC